MSMDVSSNRPPSNTPGTAPTASDPQVSGTSAGAGSLDPNSAAFAERLAKRRAVKEAFEAAGAQDGVEGKAAPKTTPKSKLDSNPYAPSAETLRKVATRADAGPVLPPPAAHVRPMTAAARRVFADHFAMRGPAVATAAGAVSATAAAVPLTTPGAVRAALETGVHNPETLTPKEAAYVKHLVGKEPPTTTFATVSEEQLQRAAKAPTYGAASSHDSYKSLKAAATTYVPWQQFYVTLSKKQQADLAVWLMQRQKLQLLSASITITMLEADKLLTQNTIMMEHVESIIKFIVANEQLKNSMTADAMSRLTNSGFSVMRSAADLSKGQRQNEDRSPTQDLHRMAFLRRVMGDSAAAADASDASFNHYVKDAPHLGLKPGAASANPTASLSVPGPPSSGSTARVPLKRSILSEDEIKQLNPQTKAQYDAAINDMHSVRGKDWPAMVGLYTHEAGICRSAAARYNDIAAAPHTSPQEAKAALEHAGVWTHRANQIDAQTKAWQDRLQDHCAIVLVDENRYGDILRERGHLTTKRNEVTAQLNDTRTPVTPDQREHLERMAMNIDWRAIALDRELGRFSNPRADNRLRRWHTGSKNIADGFYLAHAEARSKGKENADQGQGKDIPSLRWDTMAAIAPVGAVDVNRTYITAIEAMRQGRAPASFTPADFAEANLKAIDRTQLLRHIDERKDALKRFGGQEADGSYRSSHPDERVRNFHKAELQHLDAAETFFRSSPIFQGRAQPAGALGKLSISALAPKLTPRIMARAPVTFKDDAAHLHRASSSDVPPPDVALDSGKAAKFYKDKAEAGAAVMGADSDSHAAGYQNRLFERLNVIANAQQFINMDPIDQAATQSAMGNTQDIIGESASNFSEAFGQMAQERQMIQGAIDQMVSATYHVPT